MLGRNFPWLVDEMCVWNTNKDNLTMTGGRNFMPSDNKEIKLMREKIHNDQGIMAKPKLRNNVSN